MIKLSNYVMKHLNERGMREIFLVSGGGVMHLLDAVAENGIHYYCNYHEQACAVSAEAYARVTGSVGVCMVTTGPGGTNAISGVAGAWVDSIPMLILSGQVRRDILADYSILRQKGPQEGNLVAMVKPITKYAKTILDPATIRRELDFALSLATEGRPGPVWLDIPLDVQSTLIDEESLPSYEFACESDSTRRDSIRGGVRELIKIIEQSRRPLMIVGNGIHLSRSEELLDEILDLVPIPVVLPHTAKDLVPENHPRYMGVFGTAGQRRANFAVQTADCVVALGVGLNISKTGFNYTGFAPKAKKVLVDIDEGQLNYQVFKADLKIKSDVRVFLEELRHQIRAEHITIGAPATWMAACAEWKRRFPVIVDDYFTDTTHVNSYVFMDKLSDLLESNDILVAGNGLDAASYWQAFKVKKGQRTLINGNWGSMGWDLPAAVGASLGGKRRTICVTGDGSMQMNVQELLTIRHYNLPIKIFVVNNKGYSNIRATQRTFFGRFVGADQDSGVSNPNFAFLAKAFGLKYSFIRDNSELETGIRQVLAEDGPSLCELNISIEQGITPKASSFKRDDGTIESRPIEDMFPFLPRKEISDIMTRFDDDHLER